MINAYAFFAYNTAKVNSDEYVRCIMDVVEPHLRKTDLATQTIPAAFYVRKSEVLLDVETPLELPDGTFRLFTWLLYVSYVVRRSNTGKFVSVTEAKGLGTESTAKEAWEMIHFPDAYKPNKVDYEVAFSIYYWAQTYYTRDMGGYRFAIYDAVQYDSVTKSTHSIAAFMYEDYLRTMLGNNRKLLEDGPFMVKATTRLEGTDIVFSTPTFEFLLDSCPDFVRPAGQYVVRGVVTSFRNSCPVLNGAVVGTFT